MIIFAPAKINLFLAIGPKDASGYHHLDTVFVRYPALRDEIEIMPAAQLACRFSDNYGSETSVVGAIEPENNTVTQAIHLLEQRTGRSFPYHITVRKNIPPRSGLGGGASDAAAVFLFLNKEEHLGLSTAELMDLGAQVGMDVPFFISGLDVVRGTHFGEKIQALPPLPEGLKFEVHFGEKPVSTKEAYEEWDRRGLKSTAQIEPLLRALYSQDARAILTYLHNDFERLTSSSQTLLSGSGDASFSASVVDMSHRHTSE